MYRDNPEIADHGDQAVFQATVANRDRREKLVQPEVRDCPDRLDSLVNEGQLVQPGLAGYQARPDRKDLVVCRVCRASVASLALPVNRVNSEQSAVQDFQVCSISICNTFCDHKTRKTSLQPCCCADDEDPMELKYNSEICSFK